MRQAKERRPVRNWTGRATRGSVSPPRPRRCLSGEGDARGRRCADESSESGCPLSACSSCMFASSPSVLLLAAASGPALAQDTDTLDPTPPGIAQSGAAAAARQSRCAVNAGQGIVRPQADAVSRSGALDRLLCRRLPRRRRAAADQRSGLAGHAAVAQSQLGQSGADRLPRTLRQERQEGRLERASDRRHVAAARRPDDHRPCQPSGRARCRYLVHADARPRADAARSASSPAPSTWSRPTGSTSIRKCGRMRAPNSSAPRRRIRRSTRIFVNAAIKKAMCREAGSDRGLAIESAAVVGPRRAFPHPHRLSGRQPRMQAATAAGSGRRLRPRARLLVQGIDAASDAAARSRPKPKPALTLAGLPAACKQIVSAP